MKEISPLFKPFEFSPVEKDEAGMPFFVVVPSEFYGVMVAVAEGRKEAKASGNPYPKRGQIKKKIFNAVGDWIASVCPSINCASAAEDEAPHFLKSPTRAKRVQIKARIFKELLRQIPAK